MYIKITIYFASLDSISCKASLPTVHSQNRQQTRLLSTPADFSWFLSHAINSERCRGKNVQMC